LVFSTHEAGLHINAETVEDFPIDLYVFVKRLV